MPKHQSKAAWLREWIKRIGKNDIYSTDGKVIFCNACEKQVLKTAKDNKFIFKNNKVQCDQYFQLQQHDETAKHKGNLQKFLRVGNKQQFLTTPKTTKGPDPDQFSMDLCQAFIAADIPLNKLDNSKFRSFLENYTNKIVPNRSTINKNYIKKCYENVNL